MSTPKYWPLITDPEGEIYDNPAWDLPGFRRCQPAAEKSTRRPSRQTGTGSCV
jgi:hypothetical protein